MSTQGLEKKVAIVTGAGQGIGLEICRQLCEAGATVFLNDIEQSLAEEAAASMQKAKGTCTAFPGDAADVNFIQKMVQEVVKRSGSLDIAIANAGITLFGDFFTYRPEDFNKVVKLNIGGSFFLAQAAANQMKKQKTGGSILFMSSVTGHQAHQYLEAYGITKAAVEMLAKTLVIELSPLNIRVNAIAPGATRTERTLQDPDYEAKWAGVTPLRKPASPLDIANAALFLVSPQAGHISGQTLVVDGGWSSTSPTP